MAPVSAFTTPTHRGGVRHGGAPPPAVLVSNLEQARRRRPAQINAARAVKQQRRGYARAVLQGVARTHRGLPAGHIQKTLTQALKPLGVRLSPTTLRELAATSRPATPSSCPDRR